MQVGTNGKIGYNHISLTFQQFLVRIALTAWRALRWVGRGLVLLVRVLGQPVVWIGRGLFRFFLLPLYRTYTGVKQSIRRNPHFEGLRNFQHFVERYAVYVALVAFGTFTVAHNITARTIHPDEVGTGAVWRSYAENDVGTLIIETGVSVAKAQTTHVAVGGPVASVATDVTTTSNSVDPLQTSGGIDTIGGPIQNTATPIRHEVETYTVQGGDTISGIATKFDVTNHTILWANGLGEDDLIKPGQTLKIPPTSGYLYSVKKGDTLASILKKYGGKEQDVLDANALPTADAIQPGQQIIIPGGEPPAPPAPVVTPRRSLLAQIFTGPSSNPPPSTKATGAKFIWPTPNHHINQYYRGSIHTGIDIEGDYSSPIYAAASGTVTFAAYDRSGYGLHIVISHGNGYQTLYGHASKIFVKTGQHVSQGQTIAMVGSTGRSTGTHLHFEVRTGGGFLNPLIFF